MIAAGIDSATSLSTTSKEILGRLQSKLADLAAGIDVMTKGEYDAWVDALSFEEFIAFVGLGQNGFLAILQGDHKALVAA